MNNERKILTATVAEYAKMALSASGLKKGVDYYVTSSQIYFKVDMDGIKKRKMTATFETVFSQCFFCWETPRTLIWE